MSRGDCHHEETFEVSFDNITGGFAAGTDADADHAIVQLHLDDHTAQRVDAPADAGVLVWLVHRHGVCDGRIDEPMASWLKVIVCPAAGLVDVGANFSDLGAFHRVILPKRLKGIMAFVLASEGIAQRLARCGASVLSISQHLCAVDNDIIHAHGVAAGVLVI